MTGWRPRPRSAAHRLDEPGDDDVEVADDAVVRDLEDRRVPVGVDRDDLRRVLHAREVLDRARDAAADEERRAHRRARLADQDANIAGMVMQSQSDIRALAQNSAYLQERLYLLEDKSYGIKENENLKDLNSQQRNILSGCLNEASKLYAMPSNEQRLYANELLNYLNADAQVANLEDALDDLEDNAKRKILSCVITYMYLYDHTAESMEQDEQEDFIDLFDLGRKTIKSLKQQTVDTYRLRGVDGCIDRYITAPIEITEETPFEVELPEPKAAEEPPEAQAEENGEEAINILLEKDVDVVILDIMMPKKDGFTLAQEIRSINPDIPVIFLTAKTMKEDILEGFKIGADDYLTKPFSMEELLLRIEAILRRVKGKKMKDIPFYKLGKFLFDTQKQTLSIEDKTTKLTTKECELLSLLCSHANEILERNYALKTIWVDDNYFNARSMDVYITKLRKLLKDDPGIEIINIHGKGYKLITPSAENQHNEGDIRVL